MEHQDWTRLRWRMRGAWQWPTFAAATAAEALLLNLLPVWGDGAEGLVPGLLIAGSLNLIVVALAAPVGGWLLRRRRPDIPRAIAKDYAGAALLGALLVALVAAGLAHRGELRAERQARAAQYAAVSHYVSRQAPAYRRWLAGADTVRLEKDVYRTCVPGPDPDRWLCLFVDTGQHPPGITRDGDATPNRAYQRGGFD